MKISFLVTKSLLEGGGGIEKYTREVGRRLVSKGHHVTVYSTGEKRLRPESWEGIQIHWMTRFRPHWVEKMGGAVNATAQALLLRERPDVFHLHSVAAGGLGSLLRLRHVPCVLQMHGVEWQRSRWGRAGRVTLRSLERMSFAAATTVTAVSRRQCEFYAEQYSTPVSFVPTGTDLYPYAPPARLREFGIEPSRYFLTAVRLVPEKGVHYLIRAFRKISSDWSLAIAGGDAGDADYSKHLRQLAAGDPRIHFLGHLQSDVLGEMYSNAGAYVQASEIEGMSISLLDAMSYGCCCIASDIPENLDVLGDAGITFRSTDVESLAAQMAAVSRFPDTVSPLGERARKLVNAQFSWDSVTTQLELLYQDAIQRCTSSTQTLPVRRLAGNSEMNRGMAVDPHQQP